MIAISNVKLSDVANALGVNDTLQSCYIGNSDPYNIYGFNCDYAPVAYRSVSSVGDVPDMVPFYLNPKYPYKLGYYRGYIHRMIEPIPYMDVPDYSPLSGTNKVKLHIHVDGMLQNLNMLRYYPGLVFLSGSGNYAYTSMSNMEDMLGTLIDYDVNEDFVVQAIEYKDTLVPEWLPEGEYTVYPVAASSAIRTRDSWSASLVRLGSINSVLLRSDNAYAVGWTLTASYVSSSQRYTYKADVRNTGAFLVYLTYKLTINRSLDDSVVTVLQDTKTVTLAKGAQRTLASGEGTQRGMNSNYLRVEYSISATSGGLVQDSGVEIREFKSV